MSWSKKSTTAINDNVIKFDLLLTDDGCNHKINGCPKFLLGYLADACNPLCLEEKMTESHSDSHSVLHVVDLPDLGRG